MIEQWEKIIEYEIEFYKKFPDYKQELLVYLKENAFIRVPITIFNEDQGAIYRYCPGTEEQALKRIEISERIESALNRGAKRINRLLNSIRQLEDHEQRIAYILLEKDLFNRDKDMALGLSIEEFRTAKRIVLKKIYAIYKKERDEFIKEIEKERKEKFLKNVTLYKQQIGGV